MPQIRHTVREMEYETFLGTSIEETYFVGNGDNVLTLDLRASIASTRDDTESREDLMVQCTVYPDLGNFVPASCTGLEPFGYMHSVKGIQPTKLLVKVTGQNQEDGTAAGEIVIKHLPIISDDMVCGASMGSYMNYGNQNGQPATITTTWSTGENTANTLDASASASSWEFPMVFWNEQSTPYNPLLGSLCQGVSVENYQGVMYNLEVLESSNLRLPN